MMPRQVKRLRVMRLPRLSRHRLPGAQHICARRQKYSDYAETILKNLSGRNIWQPKAAIKGYDADAFHRLTAAWL